MAREQRKRLLLLSVGYGQGHHSAASALSEYYDNQGWDSRVVDVCEMAQPLGFKITQRFYSFCVRRAPWLWGVTYALTDTADWARLVNQPFFKRVVDYTRVLLHEYNPHLVICTYPLFAYILDKLRDERVEVPPCVVVVTDAREISRPWMKTKAPLVIVPDIGSRRMMMERYALAPERIAAAGFPVHKAFVQSDARQAPTHCNLRVLYGAYRQTSGVINDIDALLSNFPQLKLTVIGANRAGRIAAHFTEACSSGRLTVLRSTRNMAELLAESHFYIGKAGAATMFECYACNVPVIVNFLLPGQERGNLDLLLSDSAGCHVESTNHLVLSLSGLLEHNAFGWSLCCAAMKHANRVGAVGKIADAIKKKFQL